MSTVEQMMVDNLKDRISTRDEALVIADTLIETLEGMINSSEEKSRLVCHAMLINKYKELRRWNNEIVAIKTN